MRKLINNKFQLLHSFGSYRSQKQHVFVIPPLEGRQSTALEDRRDTGGGFSINNFTSFINRLFCFSGGVKIKFIFDKSIRVLPLCPPPKGESNPLNLCLLNLKIVLFLSTVLFFNSCRKPTQTQNEIPATITNSFLVLNEGLFQHNNSTLTYFNWHTHQQHDNLFEAKNEWGMGDTGNDMGIYGSKLYIVMNNSHVVHVLNRQSGKLLEQIHLHENGLGASPRYLAFHAGKVYVSAFNGYLYQIDTTSLQLENKILLGTNPDQLCVVQNELWVSNSGGLTTHGDSTISVVDLNSFSELQKIVVGRNPGSIVYDGTGSVFVVSRGNYADIPSKIVKLDVNTKSVVLSENRVLSSLRYWDGQLFAMGYHFESSSSSIQILNPNDFSEQTANLISHLPLQTLYGFQKINVLGQWVYVLLDARQYIHQGNVLVCDMNFNVLFEFKVGLNPCKVLFND
jgi:hypothetical protein